MRNYGPILAFGIPLLLGLAFFVWARRYERRPSTPIVVVDRRTYRLAKQRIDQAEDAGQYARAVAGITAVSIWLRGEIHTGPRRHRIRYAADLEQWEMRADQIKQIVGVVSRAW